MSASQVLLLPNFTMIVACALRVLDGYDTIDLIEQACHSVCVCVRVSPTACLQV